MRNLIILVILFLNINICFADTLKVPKQQLKQYQNEMETVISNEASIMRNEVQKIDVKAENLYQLFLQDKNQMKRNLELYNKLEDLEREINAPEFYFYLKLIDTTDKYISIKDKVPATGYSGALYDFIYPYLKANKISSATKISDGINKNCDTVAKIDYYMDEINSYSQAYETKKAENFYKNNVSNKLENLDEELQFYGTRNLNTKTIYISQLKIFQIFPNGFLARIFNGEGKLIFVKTTLANNLEYGDVFIPYLPIKYTGTLTSYTTLVGSKNTVPVFELVTPQEFKKRTTLPTIGENFYFVPKPEWKKSLESVSVVNYDYRHKYGTPDRHFLKY